MRCASKLECWAISLTALLAVAAGCGRAGGAASDSPRDAMRRGDERLAAIAADPRLAPLEALRRAGRFGQFVEAALSAAEQHSDCAALQLLKSEALAASGRSAQAEAAALDAAALALEASDFATQGRAVRLWATTRFRQARPLDDARFDELLAALPADETVAPVLRFWREALDGNAPYRLAEPESDEPVEIRVARSSPGSVAAELNAIEARANGVALPLVFVDTGAQHNLMTVPAAKTAGIKFGSTATQLIGFAGLEARPGMIDVLELGSLTLYDVPVLVGNSVPLSAVDGQMTLGTELMHHVSFTIDYANHRVFAQRAGGAGRVDDDPPEWQIPVWTFPQACLAQGRLASGDIVRVLVDTGNRAGTFVSPGWARHHVSGFEPPVTGLVFRHKQRKLNLQPVALGNQSLTDWPIVDTIPRGLERLDLVDVLVGHDLLAPYRLTIDLHARVLELRKMPSVTRSGDDEISEAAGEQETSRDEN